jgi:hypothetical protein
MEPLGSGICKLSTVWLNQGLANTASESETRITVSGPLAAYTQAYYLLYLQMDMRSWEGPTPKYVQRSTFREAITRSAKKTVKKIPASYVTRNSLAYRIHKSLASWATISISSRTLLHVCYYYYYPARCASAANVVCRDFDTFETFFSLSNIL